MRVADAVAFVGEHHRAVLVTARSDGRPQTSPVVTAPDDAGRPCISTRQAAAKVANVRRRPQASLLVLSDEFFGPWVQLDGRVEIVPLPAAMDLLIALYRRIAGEHPDWNDFRSAMEAERRVVLRMEVERASGPTPTRM